MPPRKAPGAAATVAGDAPRKRGRPARAQVAEPEVESGTEKTPRKRGRPPKAQATALENESRAEPTPRKRGRPPKAKETALEVDLESIPKKRGRPPKAQETAVDAEGTPKQRGRRARSEGTDDEPDLDYTPKKGRRTAESPATDDEPDQDHPPTKGGRPAKGTESTDVTMPRKRGRPPKAQAIAPEIEPTSKKRGRPPRPQATAPVIESETEPTRKKRGRPPTATEAILTPRKRGRPSDAAVAAAAAAEAEAGAEQSKKPRGRPRKSAAPAPTESATPRKRDRPAEAPDAVADGESAAAAAARTDAALVARKRGRPPRRAAAETDAATPATGTDGAARKRGRPPKEADPDPDPAPAAKRVRGRPKKEDGPLSMAAAAATGAVRTAVTTVKRGTEKPFAAAAGERGYWLMKAEPETRMATTASGKLVDVRFSIDDLAARTAPEPWDGIRNYVARNNLRAMRVGDLALFAESNTKIPGVVGVMEIVAEAHPDPGQFDADGAYYDAKAAAAGAPRWDQVLVVLRRKFGRKLPAAELKRFAGAGGPLEGLQMLRTSRLSVSRVEADEWAFIMGLVDADGEVGDGTSAEAAAAPAAGRKRKAAPPEPARNGDDGAEEFALRVQEATLVDDVGATPVKSVELGGRSLLGRIGEGIASVLASPGRAVSRALSATPGVEGGVEAAMREGRVVDGEGRGVTVEEEE